MSRKPLLACALAALAVVLAPSRADACGAIPAACNGVWTVRDKVLPQGTKAWPAPFGTRLTVFDAQGAEVAQATITDGTATLDATLPPGSYAFEADQKCDDQTRREPFSVGAAAPLPTTLGTLAVTAPAALGSVHETNTCMIAKPRRVAVNVSLDFAEGFRAYAPLAKVWATVDGKPVDYSMRSSLSGPQPPATEAGSMFVQSVEAWCPGPKVQTFAGLSDLKQMYLAEGTHTVEVHGQLAGAATELPVLTTTVTLSCAAVSFRPEGEAGDGAADPAVAESAPSSNEAGGCSTSPTQDGARHWQTIAVLALGAIATLRRSRRSRAR